MKRALRTTLVMLLGLSMLAGCSVTSGSATGTEDSTKAAASAAAPDGTNAPAGEADSVAEGTINAEGRFDKVVVAVNADPADLLPCKPNGNGKPKFFWSIYEALFDYDDENNLVPSLASGYTEESDTVWNIKLFEEIYDSEGNHITADDVVYSVNWLIETGNNIKYDVLDHVEKVDDYTVAYHWKEKPSANQLEFILVRTFIFSQTAFENHNFATEPVGTGPFVVSEFVSGSELVLEAADDYWADKTSEDVSMRLGIHKATVQTVEFKVISEASQAVVALEMGTVDFCDYVTFSMLSEFEEGGPYSEQYKVDTNLSGDYYYMMPNMASAVTGDDLNLRLAMYYALDNNAIATSMGSGYAPLKSLGTSYFYDFNSEWEEEATYVNTYDMELAKDYLSKSDYNGEEIVIVGLVNEECKNAMTMMQSLLAQVGIKASIQTYEESLMNTILAEQTGWDFVVTRLGGSTLVASWNTLFNNDVHDGKTTNWLADQKLQELYETSLADETHDDEHVKACMDYAFSIGDVYPISGMASSIVYNRKIEEIYYREGYVTVGSSRYAGQ